VKETNMILQFNPDGTSEGFNISGTVDLLDQIGEEIVFREEAIINRTQLGNMLYSMEIYDKSGHNCELCKEKKNAFVMIVDEALPYEKQVLSCTECFIKCE
jgi:hypothetical protein